MILKSLAYVVIPIYSFLFSLGYSWFTTNFSVIGNFFDRKMGFCLWGLMISIYFYLVHKKMKTLIPMNRFLKALIPTALILLFCGITTPYLPDEMPLKSFLHIVFAFFATILLLLYLLIICVSGIKRDPEFYRPFLTVLVLIMAASFGLLVLCGIISSALELFLTITTAIFSEQMIDRLMEKKEKKEQEA